MVLARIKMWIGRCIVWKNGSSCCRWEDLHLSRSVGTNGSIAAMLLEAHKNK